MAERNETKPSGMQWPRFRALVVSCSLYIHGHELCTASFEERTVGGQEEPDRKNEERNTCSAVDPALRVRVVLPNQKRPQHAGFLNKDDTN